MHRLLRVGGVAVRVFRILRLLVALLVSHVYSKGIFVLRGGARRLLATPWAFVLGEVSQVFCQQEYLEYGCNLCTFGLRDRVR